MGKSDMDHLKHREFFDAAVSELERLSVNASVSLVADSVAVNRKLAAFLADSRSIVETEAVLTIDAMTLAFDGKNDKLKNLRSATESVSSEVAFMKTALNTVNIKTAEVERLTASIDALTASLRAFQSVVNDGTLDRAAKAAAALAQEPTP